ncbi:hybrid sensor histidine kinase/response regulator [Desulfonatronovibrio magnus]|uniref:hybrid sensor histidine kinase/response regulator n=1 Tax=Desulfonatronovibrio magnus TaxID=698827 RepID=UPI000696D900|nr:PAS domain S-box protein [Desulfonatronovibrio magnus]
MITSKLFRKTLIAVVSIFVLIVAASSYFSIQVLRQQMIEEYISKALSIVHSISMSVPDIFLDRDAATIQSIIDQYMDVEGVGYVFVHDQQGMVIAHTFSPAKPEYIHAHKSSPGSKDYGPRHSLVEINGRSYLDVYDSVLMGKGGYIHIGMEMSNINSRITSALLKIQGFNLFIFSICILAMYFFMQQVSKPLVQLTESARKFKERNLESEIKVDSNDEIGELASTMEGMRREIAGYVNKLKKSISNATEELQQALTYLSSIMDNMADGLVVLDEQGRIIRYNISFKQIFSISKSNLIEEDLSIYTKRDILGFYRSTASDDHQRMEFSFEDKVRGTRHIEASISMVSMTCGLSYIISFHDITARKSMETELKSLYANLEKKVHERTEKLQEANDSLNNEIALRKNAEIQLQSEKEFFAVTLKSIGDAVLITDKQGRLVFVNRVAEEILGISLENVKEKSFHTVFKLRDNLGESIEPFKRVIKTNKIYEKARGVILTGQNGVDYQISFKISPIYDRYSQILGTVMVFQDISDLLYLEEERLRKEKLESIGLLAGGIAHDFNNILTAILNHIIMVKSSMVKDDVNISKMESAQKACLRARRLTQQLLTFSKGGAPIKEATSMAELIEDTVGFALRGSNVIRNLDIPSNLWPANVDPGQISQVLENLVINSAQAMPAGGEVCIEARNITLEPGSDLPLAAGKYVRLVVSDNGCGIDSDNLQKIFDPYFTTKKSGTGLGLATTYSIINNHNGYIEVSSTRGQGTSFTIYLPAMSAELLEDVAYSKSPIESGRGRILVLDDDQEILEVVKEALDLLGYEAELVADGKNILEEYAKSVEEKNPFDLIIMDLTVPGGMGGLETMQKLKEIYPEVKAVVSSGYSQDPVMANYREHGFLGVLAKPYTISELSSLLVRMIKT